MTATVPGVRSSLSVVIPSYERGRIAVDTIQALASLPVRALEILLVDQTQRHPPEVERQLRRLAIEGTLRWLRLEQPSIPRAMNAGLRAAHGRSVLFLDDDIVPDCRLVDAHAAAQAQPGLVAGQVLQPGEQALPMRASEDFRFNSTEPARVGEFMGGNFSVDRNIALELGGFDENFIGAAYRFEAEFAHRFRKKHGDIRFEPSASIAHLAIASGGTRAQGHHLRTLQPNHSVGAYYFLLRARPRGWVAQMVVRPLRAIRTRHHLRRPWWIPATLLAEARGFAWALRLGCGGSRLHSIPNFVEFP